MAARSQRKPCSCGGFFEATGAFVHAETCERPAKDEGELLMLHLGLLELNAGRMIKILTRKAPLFKEAKGIPKGPIRIEELEFLDEQFKRLVDDAVAARVRLHTVITTMKLKKRRKKS